MLTDVILLLFIIWLISLCPAMPSDIMYFEALSTPTKAVLLLPSEDDLPTNTMVELSLFSGDRWISLGISEPGSSVEVSLSPGSDTSRFRAQFVNGLLRSPFSTVLEVHPVGKECLD